MIIIISIIPIILIIAGLNFLLPALLVASAEIYITFSFSFINIVIFFAN